MIRLQGIAVCGGKAHGYALLWPTAVAPHNAALQPHTHPHNATPPDALAPRYLPRSFNENAVPSAQNAYNQPIAASQIEQQRQRFDQARAHVAAQLLHTQERLTASLGPQEAAIFDAQAAFLEDDSFLSIFHDALTYGLCAEDALQHALHHNEALFLSMASPTLRDRVVDLRDVWRRVMSQLRADSPSTRSDQPDTAPLSLLHSPPRALLFQSPVILVGREIYPSILADITSGCIQGILTEEGGPTSHTAILAQALQIPYITGIKGLCAAVRSDIPLALDGKTGEVWIEPDATTFSTALPSPPIPTQDATTKDHGKTLPNPTTPSIEISSPSIEISASISSTRSQPALSHPTTACGQKVILRANLSLLSELSEYKQRSAQGIGLFRTEFLFLRETSWPSEDAQFALYRQIVEKIAPEEVTFRCVDIGADKPLGCFPIPPENNPQLGWRGVRILLDHRALFIEQLQAFLRASVHGRLRVMIPMISTYEEIQIVRQCFQEAQDNLRKRGLSFDPTVPLGIMVETPAAALALPHLMPCVDFLSVGTNDLLQFVMAVDRNHTQLHHLFQPLHPGFLRLLSRIANSASQAKCPLSICGEIAANPLFLPIWLGLGFREFSVTPHAIPPLQHRLQSLHLQEAQHTAQIALSLPSSEQIHTLLETPHNALNTPPPSHL
ncbi:hypothetical protein L6R29_05580 [Myxococcota bacterium]|nr:hypothetical protein [Myxococcota bacterium]